MWVPTESENCRGEVELEQATSGRKNKTKRNLVIKEFWVYLTELIKSVSKFDNSQK